MSDAKPEKVLRVPVTPDEDQAVRGRASQVGLPIALAAEGNAHATVD